MLATRIRLNRSVIYVWLQNQLSRDIMPRDPERIYTELIFESSHKYAPWDPEVPVRVGDWGIITRGARSPWFAFLTRHRRQGIFLKYGNIYEDGRAKKFNIPPPQTHEHNGSSGISWIVSQNAVEISISGGVSACVVDRT